MLPLRFFSLISNQNFSLIPNLKVDETRTSAKMKSLLIFSTLLVCALAYRVVPNMNRGSIKPEYLNKCVNASIVAIEAYDKDGNNGLSYEEIKDVSFGAKI